MAIVSNNHIDPQASTSTSSNKRRCSHSTLPGEQSRRQRRPSIHISPLIVNTKKVDRKNVCSWSSTSSGFSTNTISTVSTPVIPTTIIALPPLPIDEDDDDDVVEEEEEDNTTSNNQPPSRLKQMDSKHNEEDDHDENEDEHRTHQRQWRRRVSRSLGRSASNGNATNVKEILTDVRLRPFLDVDAPDDETDGTTPLIYAACFGKAEVVRLLLEAGAMVNVPDKRGWTALMWATTNNHSEVVELLLQSGASSAIKTAGGRTALDFVNTENQQLKEILITQQHQEEDPLDFYYENNNENDNDADGTSPMSDANMDEDEDDTAVDDDDATATYDNDNDNDDDDDDDLLASFQSIHQFDWTKCLPDQMFVFGEENIGHILDTAITRLTLPMKTRQEIWVPANIIFLSARFAHYYSSRELLNTFLNSAADKIKLVLKENMRDIHTLAFWMANMSQLLYYLKKDTGLVVATAEHQLTIVELICETYNLLVLDSEQRIEKVLEASMLEHEPIEGLTEAIEFQDDWQRFFRRNNNKTHQQMQSLHTQYQLSPRTLSPQSITSLLSSILYVLQSYHVHPAIISQAIAQFFHFVSCELFNRILFNKKYLCRSKALQIRMNVTCLEEWVRSSHMPSGDTLITYLEPVIQQLQLLQCVSQLNELDVFAKTIKTFELLNPLQTKRVIINYRYEVAEPRLPDAVEKYVIQAADNTVSLHRSASMDHTIYHPKTSARPTSVSSLGSLLMMRSSSRRQQLQQQRQQKEQEEQYDALEDDNSEPMTPRIRDDEDSIRQWAEEKRDSRYMLPFSLPNTSTEWKKQVGTAYNESEAATASEYTAAAAAAAAAEGMSISEAMCFELKQKLGAERESNRKEQCGIVPTIPEEWMDRLDCRLVS